MGRTYLQEAYELLFPVNEVYFGNDNKELDELQKQFSKFRSNWLNKGVYNKRINTDTELQKFNRLIEKFFGFKRFALVVEPNAVKNAYTFPLSGRIDVSPDTSKYLIKTPNGFKYSKETEYSCMVFINSSLIVDSHYTDREVMAIIFHEIGHNFQQNFNPASTFNGCLMKALNLASIPIHSIEIILDPLNSEVHAQSVVGSVDALNRNVIKAADKLKQENPEFVQATYMIKNIISIFKTVTTNIIVFISNALILFNPIGNLIVMVYEKILDIVKNPFDILLSALGYKGEKLSDEFATIYGYGADLSSALEKMDFGHRSGLLANDVWSGWSIYKVVDLVQLPIKFLFAPFEPHPETVSRANNQLKLLEKELTKNGIDPRMEKQIKEDMDKIRSSIKRMTTVKFNDSYAIRKAYAAYLLNTCGGDLRELFNKNKPIGNYDKFDDDPVSKVKFK